MVTEIQGWYRRRATNGNMLRLKLLACLFEILYSKKKKKKKERKKEKRKKENIPIRKCDFNPKNVAWFIATFISLAYFLSFFRNLISFYLV